MRSLYCSALVMVLGVGMVGCEWKGGGSGGGSAGGSSFDTSAGYANFAGTYEAAGGGFVVSMSTSTQTTNTINTTQQIGTGPAGGSQGPFQGTLANLPVVQGSVNVSWSSGSVTETAAHDGTLAGTGSGTINYNTGFITVTPDATHKAAGPVVASYSYLAVDASGTASGITSLNVQQEGNSITIVDNNGKSYHGTMGATHTSSGGAVTTATDGDEVTSEFSASGQDSDGKNVNLVGTFRATAVGTASGTTSTITFTKRQINGSWIEDGGHTATISGTAD